MRFLVLTAAFGDGHNSAARNVSRALEEVTDGRCKCPVFDPIAMGNPLTSSALQAGYQLAITSLPAVWRFLYRRTESLDLSRTPIELFNGVVDWLETEMQRFRPVGIVSTYPLYANLIRRIDGNIPVYTVITDSITVHKSWTTTPSTLHFVSDEHSKAVTEANGVPGDTIQVTGFPVALEFARRPPPERVELKRLLWFAATKTRHAIQTLRSLLATLPDRVSLTIVLGRHAARLARPVEKELARNQGQRSVVVLPWCDEVPRLMLDHDFALTKAGGATTHECAAAAIPMGLNYVVPGQEEGNAQLAKRRGCAVEISRARDTGPILRSLIEKGTFSQLAKNAAKQGVQDGAFRIAKAILTAHSASLKTAP